MLVGGVLLCVRRGEFGDPRDLVDEEADGPRHIFIVRREDLQTVSTHAEIAAGEGLVVALVLERDELPDDLAAVGDLSLLQIEDHRRIGFDRSEEHTSELQSLMRISYAVFCLKKKNNNNHHF